MRIHCPSIIASIHSRMPIVIMYIVVLFSLQPFGNEKWILFTEFEYPQNASANKTAERDWCRCEQCVRFVFITVTPLCAKLYWFFIDDGTRTITIRLLCALRNMCKVCRSYVMSGIWSYASRHTHNTTLKDVFCVRHAIRFSDAPMTTQGAAANVYPMWLCSLSVRVQCVIALNCKLDAQHK